MYLDHGFPLTPLLPDSAPPCPSTSCPLLFYFFKDPSSTVDVAHVLSDV